MKKMLSIAAAFIVAMAVAIPAQAADKGNVSIELTHQKVSKGADGKEKMESAEAAKPGEVIEYRAVYKNRGKTPVKNLLADLPVPKGMEYIPGSAKPASVQATIDGKVFSPVPLKRKVKLANGTEEIRPVPVAEYTGLRWDLKELGAGKSTPVSARMKISNQ